jgi:superoxide dismutase, Fe-Mn family
MASSVFGKRRLGDSGSTVDRVRARPMGPFSHQPLPWPVDALQPVMSAAAVLAHHEEQNRHLHELNALVRNSPLANCSLLELALRAARLQTPVTEKSSVLSRVCLNAAQLWNHTFFFASLRPPRLRPVNTRTSTSTSTTVSRMEVAPPLPPPSCVLVLLERYFGGLGDFQRRFTHTALDHFGSGWLWLVQEPREGVLQLFSAHDAENPLPRGLKPLLAIDLWEHAYLHDFGGDRAIYLTAFWLVVDWTRVADRLLAPCL